MLHTIFDGHCDTVKVLCDKNQSLLKNDCHIDIDKMSKNNHIQFFAAFINAKKDILPPFQRCNKLIDYYHKEIMENFSKIQHCCSKTEIIDAVAAGKIAALLSVEGGEALAGKLENLLYFYNRGVRMMTLCWNYQNEICSGVDAVIDTGLTEFGEAVVDKMNEIGMIVDVSHMSEKSFWDTVQKSKAPIMASHSNAFSIQNHKRNLKDEQITAIIKNNGCIGINLYAAFLGDENCNISTVIKHIEYILALGGENNIGFGSDFDGMKVPPEGIRSIQDIQKIPEEMLRMGYSEELVKKITHENFLRLISNVLK